MVSVQAGCSVDEALALMKDRALIEHLTLWMLAAAILEHVIRFN